MDREEAKHRMRTPPAPEDGGSRPHGAESANLLGRLLVEQGKIQESDVERVVDYARRKHLRFGEAAVKLRLISRHDLEHAVAAQFDYPYLARDTGGYSSKLVAAFEPFSLKGQALRNLRSQLLLRWHSDAHQTLAVVSPDDKETSSYIAANLAIVFSQLGQRALLVDADLPNARQHELFRVKNDVGLSAVLVSRAAVASVTKKLSLFRDLYIIPAGAPPPNPTELLGRRELLKMMTELRHQYDVIIFDAPPVSANSGAELIAGACGSALAVLRKNRTYVSDATSLMDAVREAGADIVGSVMANP